jgi:hypothetical protein
MSEVRWQAYRLVNRAAEFGGPFEEPVGEPFTAPNKGQASAIGRRRVGRDFAHVRSTASIACDEAVERRYAPDDEEVA